MTIACLRIYAAGMFGVCEACHRHACRMCAAVTGMHGALSSVCCGPFCDALALLLQACM